MAKTGMMGEACRVVIADDDEEDYHFLMEAFRDLRISFGVRHVTDGEQLLGYLSRLSEGGEAFPHLILLDVNMPKVDGVRALEALKASPVFNSIPIIMYSTSRCPKERNKCYRIGAHAVITKASNYKDILLFARYIRRFLQHNR